MTAWVIPATSSRLGIYNGEPESLGPASQLCNAIKLLNICSLISHPDFERVSCFVCPLNSGEKPIIDKLKFDSWYSLK